MDEMYDFQNTLLSKMVCIVWYETKLIMYLFWFKTSIILSYFSQKWQTHSKKVSQKERETKKACLKQKFFVWNKKYHFLDQMTWFWTKTVATTLPKAVEKSNLYVDESD